MQLRSGLRVLAGVVLAVATVLFGTMGMLILIASTAWGGGTWIAAALLGAAAASGGALATLWKQDADRWPMGQADQFGAVGPDHLVTDRAEVPGP